MITDGVDVLFPFLNVISLPKYLVEMSDEGVKPGFLHEQEHGDREEHRRGHPDDSHAARGALVRHGTG